MTKIQHILESGQIETNATAKASLLDTLKIVPNMFRSRPECIDEAYDRQGQRIAFAKEEKQVAIGESIMERIEVFTIGFTQKKAEYFFETLKQSAVKRIVDVRLNNVSQLAGFAKKDDLMYFLKQVCNIDYVHLPELAPTKDILDAYKKSPDDWPTYERKFIELMESRHIEDKIAKEILNGGCLLCSEAKPHHCHRRLVAEYLQRKWKEDMAITHII